MPGTLRHFLDAIKFEHTVFALPFAFIAMLLAAGGWPGWWVVGWISAAMVGARTCAMAAAASRCQALTCSALSRLTYTRCRST